MSDDLLKPGGALSGRLFEGFMRRLADIRELEVGERIGPFRIRAEIGRGGSGVVYLAERADGAFTQQVALKWLRGDRPVPGGRAILARERELLASLDHPHIARLVDGGESEDGQLWFAMDHVEGEPIDQGADDQAAVEHVARVCDLCRAVHHAHSRGLIHGDIKPANVLIDQRGKVRLLDFGIARLQDSALGGSYGLTPEFASPEQRRGEPLTTASDVWQLGRLLKELLASGRIAADLKAVIERAMAEDPRQRYSSAAALAAELQAWLDGRPVSVYGGLAYRLRRLAGRHQVLIAVVLVAVLSLVAAGLAANRQLAAERDRAQLAANQAKTALAEAEAALARADQLRDFLVGLFRAAEPDRPRDQLPDTEALLAMGAERALDPESAPPLDRLGMLQTLARVQMTLGRSEQAAALLDAGRALAEQHPEAPREDRVGLLALSGHLAMSRGEAEQAEQWLLAAEQLAGDSVRAADSAALARSRRAWLAFMQGRHEQALDLLEPLEAAAASDELVLRPATRLQLLNALAAVKLALGDLSAAADLRARAVDQARRLDGPNSRAYAIQLANLAVVQLRAGAFDSAQASLEAAIALYDRIFDRPVVLRAAARANLANLHLYRGEDAQALAVFETAADEWADAQGRDREDYEFRHHNRGRMKLRMGDHERAERELLVARELFRQQAQAPSTAVAMTEVWLARSQCALGRADQGWSTLAPIDFAALSDDPAQRAEWQESRAVCLLALGRPEVALAAVRASLAELDWPGYARLLVDRRRLEARILAELEP
jgi:eukaryotic-like serine/threonine-protein kinase